MVKGYPPYLDYPKPRKPITNGDRIRSMTDEELADLLHDFGMSSLVENGKTAIAISAEKYHILMWLKQPYEGS